MKLIWYVYNEKDDKDKFKNAVIQQERARKEIKQKE